jgi:hypothetical protein
VVFQGDSLSHLLFFISLIPLTEQLNKLNTGYEEHTTRTEIPHTLYMNNLKLMGKTEEELQKQMQTVWNFSDDDMLMKFRLDICTKIVLKKGKLIHLQNLNKKYKSLNREKSTRTKGLRNVKVYNINK